MEDATCLLSECDSLLQFSDNSKCLDTPKHVSRNRGCLSDKVSNTKKLKTAPDRSCLQVYDMPDIHVMPSVRHERCTQPRADRAIKQIHIFLNSKNSSVRLRRPSSRLRHVLGRGAGTFYETQAAVDRTHHPALHSADVRAARLLANRGHQVAWRH